MTLTADLHTITTWENYLDTLFALTCTNLYAIYEQRPAIIRLFFYCFFQFFIFFFAASIFLNNFQHCHICLHHGIIHCIMYTIYCHAVVSDNSLYFLGVLSFFLSWFSVFLSLQKLGRRPCSQNFR